MIVLSFVIPAKAGIPLFFSTVAEVSGPPAFAGVTSGGQVA
jgi:hypothetical protein